MAATDEPRLVNSAEHGLGTSLKEFVMSHHNLAVVRDEVGATTAEYATVTGAGVGFGVLLWKFLTSDAGQELIKMVFKAIFHLLPFV